MMFSKWCNYYSDYAEMFKPVKIPLWRESDLPKGPRKSRLLLALMERM